MSNNKVSDVEEKDSVNAEKSTVPASVVIPKDKAVNADPAEAERIRIVAYLSYDTVYSDNFCLRCSHDPSNCECANPVYMPGGWTPSDELKSLKVALFQEDRSQDSIHFNALLVTLQRLKSKNRNPERDWYLGWNSALDCLTNDINARTRPSTQANSGPQTQQVPDQGSVLHDPEVPESVSAPPVVDSREYQRGVKDAAQVCYAFMQEFGPQAEGSVAQECGDRISALAATPVEQNQNEQG